MTSSCIHSFLFQHIRFVVTIAQQTVNTLVTHMCLSELYITSLARVMDFPEPMLSHFRLNCTILNKFEISIQTKVFLVWKLHIKMRFATWLPFWLGVDILIRDCHGVENSLVFICNYTSLKGNYITDIKLVRQNNVMEILQHFHRYLRTPLPAVAQEKWDGRKLCSHPLRIDTLSSIYDSGSINYKFGLLVRHCPWPRENIVPEQ